MSASETPPARPGAAFPLASVLSSFLPDCRRYSVSVAVLRAARSTRVLGMRGLQEAIEAQPALWRHMALRRESDATFFLSHRHYLAQGLPARARAEAALTHYRHESEAFDPDYLDRVYAPEGLTLWAREAGGQSYDIRLLAGQDVLHEGGLSLVLHVNGGRVCVLSFSTVPLALVAGRGPAAPPGAVAPFVVRKHLAQDHSYQAAFHRAFDRATPAHLCIGALSGIAQAQGLTHLMGVAGARQVSVTEARRADFERAYSDFWGSVGGRPAGELGYLIPAALEMSPLDEMNARQRKRARQRRAHVEAARESAAAALSAFLTA